MGCLGVMIERLGGGFSAAVETSAGDLACSVLEVCLLNRVDGMLMTEDEQDLVQTEQSEYINTK